MIERFSEWKERKSLHCLGGKKLAIHRSIMRRIHVLQNKKIKITSKNQQYVNECCFDQILCKYRENIINFLIIFS